MKKIKWLIVGCIWLTILGAAMLFLRGTKLWTAKIEEEQQEAQERQVLQNTSSESRYKHTVRMVFDGFTGYAAYRTKEFSENLSRHGIKAVILNDEAIGGDPADSMYVNRLKKLESGEIQFAAFTVGSLLAACDEIGSMPGTIVAVIDESEGADAIVAYKKTFPDLDALNQDGTRILCTPDSPAEELSRVVYSSFVLPPLSKDSGTWQFVDGSLEAYRDYKDSKSTDKKAWVVWEPYVSKILENPNTHVLIDSSTFRGYITDVLVVDRDFLFKNKSVVRQVLEAYHRAHFKYQNDMATLARADTILVGDPISEQQAQAIKDKIWWKNVTENYAHFGVLPGNENVQHLEDIINKVSRMLVKTGGLTSDPTQGRPNQLYYNGLYQELHDSNFHPGTSVDSAGDLRAEIKLPDLTDAEWQSLATVGTLQVDRITFSRGSSELTSRSKNALTLLAKELKSWPAYYCSARGNAASIDDQELAMERADAAVQFLIAQGIDKSRIRAVAGMPSGQTSVSFVLGQKPY